MKRAGAYSHRLVVVHVEPDLWGYIEQAARGGKAATVPAAVASTPRRGAARPAQQRLGLRAGALIRLRDRLAPNVALAWHLSVWGTKEDPTYSKPPLAHMDVLAARSAAFYKSLHANFDLVFTDVADRDAGYDEKVNHDGGKSWWHADDYARQVAYLAGFTRRTHVGVVLWQIPLGNTMLDNTPEPLPGQPRAVVAVGSRQTATWPPTATRVWSRCCSAAAPAARRRSTPTAATSSAA